MSNSNLKSAVIGMRLVMSAASATVAHTQSGAQASEYPNRPIRMITPAQPGGTTDILARVFGAKLADLYKQQIVVHNRASASGVIAGELTAKVAPDGYTLFMA